MKNKFKVGKIYKNGRGVIAIAVPVEIPDES